jgi:hypothetical protein
VYLGGRYDSEVHAVSTDTGRLMARIPVGARRHGLSIRLSPGVSR